MSTKTATIDYEDYEILLGGAVAAIAVTEQFLPQAATPERKAATEASIAQLRASVERAMKTVTTGVRAQSFQDRLSEAIAAARAKA